MRGTLLPGSGNHRATLFHPFCWNDCGTDEVRRPLSGDARRLAQIVTGEFDEGCRCRVLLQCNEVTYALR